jgi:hypothetical protein
LVSGGKMVVEQLTMATYLIDYENKIGQAFIAVADSFFFRDCDRLSDYYKTYVASKPCNSFWETVKRPQCYLCDNCEPLRNDEINGMNNLCRDCENHCVPIGSETLAETKAKGEPLQRSKSVICRKHCYLDCSCNRVILFYSMNTPKKNREKIIAKCTEAFEYQPNGVSNGLDFQLTTYLGSAIRDDTGFFTDSRFYIVSEDKGFSSAIHFWENNEDAQINGISFGLLQSKPDIHKAFLESPPFNVGFESISDLNALHNELQRIVGSNEECKKLYRELKPLYKTKV